MQGTRCWSSHGSKYGAELQERCKDSYGFVVVQRIGREREKGKRKRREGEREKALVPQVHWTCSWNSFDSFSELTFLSSLQFKNESPMYSTVKKPAICYEKIVIIHAFKVIRSRIELSFSRGTKLNWKKKLFTWPCHCLPVRSRGGEKKNPTMNFFGPSIHKRRKYEWNFHFKRNISAVPFF